MSSVRTYMPVAQSDTPSDTLKKPPPLHAAASAGAGAESRPAFLRKAPSQRGTADNMHRRCTDSPRPAAPEPDVQTRALKILRTKLRHIIIIDIQKILRHADSVPDHMIQRHFFPLRIIAPRQLFPKQIADLIVWLPKSLIV